MLSDDIKEIGQDLVDLAELKIEALRFTLPNKQQTLNELDIAMNQNRPQSAQKFTQKEDEKDYSRIV